MSYVCTNYATLENTNMVGTHQCVDLVKLKCGAPQTALWKKGVVVKGTPNITPGTAIATLHGGSYANNSTGNHAAIYVDQDASGIYVLDQWNNKPGGKITKRKLPFKGFNKDGKPIDPSNNGDAFWVIE
ncbi:BPSL0067 family protein [Neisseriaceae bacterium TC5R-5]|nr:BPSL0067 family protein [Neisseriaceae bacterium TC5R-5]